MRRTIAGIVGTIGLCFISGFVATLAWQRRHAAEGSDSARDMRPIGQHPAWWNQRLLIGDPEAEFRITEFSDFQCPFCARAVAVLDSLRALHPDSIAINYLHFPLTDVHPSAWRAAIVAECAARVGHFEAAYRYLFNSQSLLDSLSADELYVRAAGAIDRRSTPCVSDSSTAAVVRRDVEDANRLALRGTPAIIVGRTLIEGAPTLRSLDSVFLAERASARLASAK